MNAFSLVRGADLQSMGSELRVITKRYGNILGPTYTVAFGDKYYAVGELTLNQLKRGLTPDELDLFEVDPDAEGED